ncbi:MAG: glycosyl hydrolase family 28 protein, partial [Bacilli bacterium]|nr:glycosyl hydrolase family 28 protein [Bacilli bacterium]
MKRHHKKVFILLLVFFCSFLVSCKPEDLPPEEENKNTVEDKTVTETKLTVYEGPNLLETSKKVAVKVEDQELFVYETRVNHSRIFSFSEPKTMAPVVVFDFEGLVKIEVIVNAVESLSEVVIRPLSYEIKPLVSGNKISFSLNYSGNYVLEYNDGKGKAHENAVHIFANPLETDPIDPDLIPEDVIYLGPGVYAAGAIPIQSKKTVYLAGGAYVYGQIRAELMEDITIRGRGIISGEIYERTRASEYTIPIEMRSCENVKIEGITILDPAGWTVALYKCKNVEIENLKMITARGNGDGISVQSCEDVKVFGGFVRSWDDSLVVKNSDRGNTKNIVFDNVVVWTDLAQSCEVGFETNGEKMENIIFKNITILHNFHKAA